MLRLFLVSVALLAVFAPQLHAQDPQYSQFFANKLWLSPAFAGSGGGPRVALNFRNQWPQIPNSYVTYGASFDMPFYFGKRSREPRHGMGLNFMTDQAGAGQLRKIDVNLNYAFLLPLDRFYKHNIRMGISAGIQQASIDFFRLQFPDQFDVNDPTGPIDPTSRDDVIYNLGDGGSRIHEEIGAGALYYNPRFYFGVNVKHLSMPQQNFVLDGASDQQLPMHIAAFTGFNIPLKPNSPRPEEGPTLSPAFQFTYQQPFYQAQIGLYANFDPFVIGTWYRAINNDALVFLVGVSRGIFNIGYSFDLTLSDLGLSNTGGAHEVSVVLTFDGKGPKPGRPSAKMSCPRF